MNFKRAIIDWIPFEEGGRRNPPTGEEPPIYWAVVKFVDNTTDTEPPTNSWSLAVRLVELLGGPYRWAADVKFRVEEAPHYLITEGAEFELYEGKKRVATGLVTASGQ